MWAIVIHASADAIVFFQSLASLWQRPSVPLHHPPARQDGEALDLVGTLDYFHRPSADLLRSPFQLVARIAAIGEYMPKSGPAVMALAPFDQCSWRWSRTKTYEAQPITKPVIPQQL